MWRNFSRFQKQLLSSPTISHDDEDQQSDGTAGAANEEKEQDADEDEGEANGEVEKEVEQPPMAEVEQQVVIAKPLKAMYENRDILDLSQNLIGSGQFVQFTVLPENNVSCFFQNRAQYWRLSSGEQQEHLLEKCSCCDFTYPSTQQPLNQGPSAAKKINANAVTESLLTFLKSSDQMTPVPNNNVVRNRVMHNSATISSYPVPPQQPAQPPQQYPTQGNGFYNGNNSFNNTSYNQQINPFMNNSGGYGNTMALLSMMSNSSRNVSNAFPAMSGNANNSSRFYNNNSTMNNGYGLYKQF